MLTTVEKVIILQNVDIFEFVLTEGLSQIAVIADEVAASPGQKIFSEGDLPDSMYIVLEGGARITRDGKEIVTVESGGEFGAWGIFDDAPRLLTAVADGDCRLLKIEREEFLEILSDSPYLTEYVLRKIVKRMRILMSRLNTCSEADDLQTEILKTFL